MDPNQLNNQQPQTPQYQAPQYQQPMPPEQPAQQPAPTYSPVNIPPAPHEKKVGPIVATLVIVLILILAALWLFASKVNQPAAPVRALDQQPQQQQQTQAAAPAPNSAEDLNDLNADLNTSVDGLDSQNF